MQCGILCCLSAPQADPKRFWRVIVLWVSTTKRKTRLHTDFRSARRSKRINPPKITRPTHFLRRIEEEMLKLHFSSLATRFRPQRLRSGTFFSKFLRSQLQKTARVTNPYTLAVGKVHWVTIISPTRGRQRLFVTSRHFGLRVVAPNRQLLYSARSTLFPVEFSGIQACLTSSGAGFHVHAVQNRVQGRTRPFFAVVLD